MYRLYTVSYVYSNKAHFHYFINNCSISCRKAELLKVVAEQQGEIPSFWVITCIMRRL